MSNASGVKGRLGDQAALACLQTSLMAGPAKKFQSCHRKGEETKLRGSNVQGQLLSGKLFARSVDDEGSNQGAKRFGLSVQYGAWEAETDHGEVKLLWRGVGWARVRKAGGVESGVWEIGDETCRRVTDCCKYKRFGALRTRSCNDLFDFWGVAIKSGVALRRQGPFWTAACAFMLLVCTSPLCVGQGSDGDSNTNTSLAAAIVIKRQCVSGDVCCSLPPCRCGQYVQCVGTSCVSATVRVPFCP